MTDRPPILDRYRAELRAAVAEIGRLRADRSRLESDLAAARAVAAFDERLARLEALVERSIAPAPATQAPDIDARIDRALADFEALLRDNHEHQSGGDGDGGAQE